MNPSGSLVCALLDALRGVDGLRPSAPSTAPAMAWVPWNWDALAVDITADLVRVHVVATRLPLPDRLHQAGEAMCRAMHGTPWSTARLQLVVTDIDHTAFTHSVDRPTDA